ncbi:MAG: hypothetical protein ACRD88_20475 [Terriglobia bacterium]
MKSLKLVAGLLLGVVALSVNTAFAQSSGNFAAHLITTQCLIDNVDGSLDGGIGGTLLETTIQTPNSKFTALDIRPSLVSGLYTKSRVTEDVTTSTAWAGLQVRVLIDGKVVAPGVDTTGGSLADAEDGWVYYNKRWQQINQNFLGKIDACVDDDPTTDACFLELIQATLSANSLDFVVGNVGGGSHTLKAEWRFEDSDANGGNAAACVGPGVLTVTQVKTFSTGGGIVIEP